MTAISKRSRGADDMTLSLAKLLTDILVSPEAFATLSSLKSALATQDGIAQYRDDGRKLKPRSLDTLRRSADRCYAGGFEQIEELRLQAAAKLGVQTLFEKVRARREAQKEEIKQLTLDLLHARQDLWHLTAVLKRSMQQARQYAEKASNPSVATLCRREQAELMAALSLMKSSADIQA